MARNNPPPPLKPSRDQDPKDRSPKDRNPKDRKAPAKQHTPPSVAIRETIESVVIAFALAFLFRTFDAEAFVIPTGSMATTLMGRHKDVVCEKCGYPYQASASEEVNTDGSQKNPPVQIESCTCPMCRYTMDVSPRNPQRKSYPSYTGDRILVGKFIYDVSDPKRWDVAVFKFPGDAQTNYIKRIVGLPHETIRIERGDLFVKGQGDNEFHIARKPPEKMLAMLRPVFDNDYMPQIAKSGWPVRWQPMSDGFKAIEDQKTFESDPAAGLSSIRYSHLVPDSEDWQRVLRGPVPGRDQPVKVRSQLITDFLGYNTKVSNDPHSPADMFGTHWVGDLALECTVDIRGDKGSLIFELVKGGRQFQCRVNLSDGTAELFIVGDDMRDFHPTAKTPLNGPGRHTVLFSNIDRQLRLYVDGNLVEFGGGDEATCYSDLGNVCPTEDDLKPAAVGVEGAAVRISGLKVLRDLFYITTVRATDGYGNSRPMPLEEIPLGKTAERFFSDPRLWPEVYRNARHTDLPLAADQFLALGDNSAQSLDSRYWGSVSRDLLTGKALFIYWPHHWNWPVPFFPNFSRMGFVR